MHRLNTQAQYRQCLFVAIVSIAVISLLTSCSPTGTATPIANNANAPMQAATDIPNTPLSATATPTELIPNPTEELQTREAYATWGAQNEAALETEVAQSTRLIPPSGPFYSESPLPTPTWESGYVVCPNPYRRRDPEFISCWKGTFNNQLVWLYAGHEQAGRDGIVEFGNGNPEQGVLQVGFYDPSQGHLLSEDLYKTPELAGPVIISGVSGSLVTLVANNHIPTTTFVLELTTRQWVSPSPGPSPSAEPSPLSSPSP